MIPRAIREALGIRPGQMLQMTVVGGCVQLTPLCLVGKMRGCLKGVDTAVEREGDRA